MTPNYTTLGEAVRQSTVEERLLHIARELKELDALLCIAGRSMEEDRLWDAMTDITAENYDTAIAKLTGNYEPPDGDPREGEICDGN